MCFDRVIFCWPHGHLDYFLPDLLTFFEKCISVWVPFQIHPGREGAGAATAVGAFSGSWARPHPPHYHMTKVCKAGAIENFRPLGAGVGVPGI